MIAHSFIWSESIVPINHSHIIRQFNPVFININHVNIIKYYNVRIKTVTPILNLLKSPILHLYHLLYFFLVKSLNSLNVKCSGHKNFL